MRSHSTEKGPQLYSRLRDDDQPKDVLSALAAKPKKAYQFLPRTGIEYPFMAERPRFIETHKEFEPVHNTPAIMSEELQKQDSEKISQ